MNATLKTLYFLGVLAEVLIRIPHERRRRRTRMAVERVDALERALVGLLSVGLIFAPAVYASTSWLERVDYRLPPEAQRSAGGVGVALMTLAVWLFWRSHADLSGATGRPRSRYARSTRSSRRAYTGTSGTRCTPPSGCGA